MHVHTHICTSVHTRTTAHTHAQVFTHMTAHTHARVHTHTHTLSLSLTHSHSLPKEAVFVMSSSENEELPVEKNVPSAVSAAVVTPELAF